MHKREAYIAVDVGTSGVKTVAVDGGGELIATAQRSLKVSWGKDGKAEQHPHQWRAATGACLQELSRKLEQNDTPVAAIAPTGQMDGPVLLDGKGDVIRNVPLWCDTRCAPQCDAIDTLIPMRELLELTGHTAVTGYTAPKLMWIKEREPEVLTRAAHLLFPKDYITFLLTGQIVTDYSDASNSILFNINSARWEGSIAEALGLKSLGLPSVTHSYDHIGNITERGSQWSGLPEGVPVAAGAGDSIAAALGAGLHDASMLQIVIGTAGNVNCVSDEILLDGKGRVHTGCFIDRQSWICSGVLQASGRSFTWWSEITGMSVEELLAELAQGAFTTSTDTTAKLVRSSDREPSTDVVFAPYLTGERTPHLDPHVRGAFVMLSSGTTRTDLTRAVVEGVVFSFRDAVEVFHGLGVQPEHFSLTGGGTKSDVVCQVFADALAAPLLRITADITVRGAAVLAACGCGRFARWQDAVHDWAPEGDSFTPRQTARYEKAFGRYRALYPYIKKYSKDQGGAVL